MKKAQSDWRPVTREGWGFSAEKSALYLFERKTIYAFKVGEGPFSPTCLRKRRDEAWTFCRGDDRLHFPSMKKKTDDYVGQLRSSMTDPEPEESVNAWRYDQFEQFFAHLDQPALSATLLAGPRTGCWPLYCTLTRVPSASALLHTPALLIALSQAWRFVEKRVCKEMRRIRRLAIKPPRSLLSELGFPSTRGTLRVLRKLDTGCLSSYHLLWLRSVMHAGDRRSKWLRHLDRINEAALLLLTHPRLRDRFSWTLLEDLALLSKVDETTHIEPVHLLKDSIRMLGDRPMPWLHNRNALSQLHERLSAEARLQEIGYREFPAPPVPGIPGAIEPITNTHALFDEGTHQENCLAAAESWADDIVRGQYYVYRLLAPERASLGICRTRGHWCVDQLYGARNRPIERGRQEVQRWLDAHETKRWRRPHGPRPGTPVNQDVDITQLHLGL